MCTGTPRSDIVGHIPRKISRNDGETYRTLLYNDRVLEMTLGLFYVLLSTSTKIFAGKNFRESVQTREKRENLHPAKLTGYTVNRVRTIQNYPAAQQPISPPLLLACVGFVRDIRCLLFSFTYYTLLMSPIAELLQYW